MQIGDDSSSSSDDESISKTPTESIDASLNHPPSDFSQHLPPKLNIADVDLPIMQPVDGLATATFESYC